MKPPPISTIRDTALEADVAALYSTTLSYHNFQHALDTIAAADRITRRCMEEGIRVDTEVVYYALLFHDAGFEADHHALGHPSKEAYSAALARDMLAARDIPVRTVEKVSDAILSTHKDANFVTVEQKAVRAADLSGLAADYETFLTNARNLKSEFEWFNARTLSWRDWVSNVSETIRFYLAQEIRLTSYFFDRDGESAFHHAVRKNLERLIAEA